MKKIDIIARLQEIIELDECPEALIDLMKEITASDDEGDDGKLTYFVTVAEQKLDPAKKYPTQMLECYKILAEQPKDTLTMAEIKKIMGESADRLKTKQDPMRIYAFYQKRMADEQWLVRTKCRI